MEVLDDAWVAMSLENSLGDDAIIVQTETMNVPLYYVV